MACGSSWSTTGNPAPGSPTQCSDIPGLWMSVPSGGRNADCPALRMRAYGSHASSLPSPCLRRGFGEDLGIDVWAARGDLDEHVMQ